MNGSTDQSRSTLDPAFDVRRCSGRTNDSIARLTSSAPSHLNRNSYRSKNGQPNALPAVVAQEKEQIKST